MSATLEVRAVTRRFGATAALADISLAVAASAHVVLLGPSGSGKTTLLSVLGGFLAPSEGQVLVDGADVTELPPARRPTTTVFQDYALFPHLSVTGNVGFGLAMRGLSRRAPPARRRRARPGRARRLLRPPGARALGRAAPARGACPGAGGRARDPAARRAARRPRRGLAAATQGELKAVQRRVGTTFVDVTHDQEEAMALADLLVVMDRRRIQDAGAPDRVYLRPRTRFAATFLGDSNPIEGRVLAAGDGHADVATGCSQVSVAADGEPVALALRPEQIAIGAAGTGLLRLGPARVTDATFLGGYWRVLARAEATGEPLLLHLPAAPAPKQGDQLDLAAAPDCLVLLPSER